MSKATEIPKPGVPAALEVPEHIIEQTKAGVILNEYKRTTFLGKGGFARVYMVQDMKTNKLLAAKAIERSKFEKSQSRSAKLQAEISIHESMNHPNIVGFVRYFLDSNFIYILLELCNNHCMMTLLKNRVRLTEPEVRYYMLQIVSAVEHMHRHRVIHRDLKLGNIFLHNMRCKLGDFGLACKLIDDSERKVTVCGTPNYIAPEILQGHKKAKGTGHSYEVDIWSTGVIMYTLLVGAAPFTAKDVDSTYKRIVNNIYEFPKDIPISNEAKDLIRWMLSPNPADRPTPREIPTHVWFKGFTPDSLPKTALHKNPFEESTRPPRPIPALTSTKAEAAKLRSPAKARSPLQPRTNIISERQPAKKESQWQTDVAPYQGKSYEEIQDLGVQLTKTLKLNEPSSKSPLKEKQKLVWVTKWIDYCSKYGLGYRLSTGAYGVYFNDNTRICLQPDGRVWHYFEVTGSHGSLTETHVTGTMAQYPPNLKKKVTLLQYFKEYLDNKLDTYPELPTPTSDSEIHIVKKFQLDRSAIIFRFADGSVQANFEDHKKILFNGKERLVGYRTNMEPAKIFKPSQVGDNEEIRTRLDYLRQILVNNLD